MLKDYKRAKNRVRMMLEKYPEARNSDKELITRYYEYFFYQGLATFRQMVEKMPNFESIRRSRQKIQQENPELRSDRQVEQARKKEEKLMTTELGSAFAGMTKAKDDMFKAIDEMKTGHDVAKKVFGYE